MNVAITLTIITTKITSFKIGLPLIKDNINTDKIMAGNVNKSPKAAIIGLVILSGSHPCSKLLNETSIVIGSIIKFEITPASTLMIIKSIKLMDGEFNKIHNPFETIAKNRDNTNVKTNEEKIL